MKVMNTWNFNVALGKCICQIPILASGCVKKSVWTYFAATCIFLATAFAYSDASAQTPEVSVNWASGFDGNVSYFGEDDSFVNQQYQVGYIEDSFSEEAYPRAFYDIQVEEFENNTLKSRGATRRNVDITSIASKYPEFRYSGTVTQLVNYSYGTWYIDEYTQGCPVSYCYGFLYVPNGRGINMISALDTVTFKIYYILQTSSTDTTPLDSDSLTVSFNKLTPPILSISEARTTEGNNGDMNNPTIDFTVNVTPAQSADFTVDYFVDYTSTNPASAADFVTVPPIETDSMHGRITFLTDTSATETDLDTTITNTTHKISLQVAHDEHNEGDETFTVVLSATSLSGVSITSTPANSRTHMAKGTITNDDAAQLSIDSPAAVSEGDGTGSTPIEFTISLNPATPLDQTFSVPVTFNHVTTDKDDFVNHAEPTIAPISFTDSNRTRKVTVFVNWDVIPEPVETFSLTIGTPTGNAADMNLVELSATTVGTGTITNDDLDSPNTPAVTVSVVADRSEINEGESVRFTLSSSPEKDLDNVAISIEQQGDNIAWSSRKSVDITKGQVSDLEIVTTVDPTDMTDGNITLRVLNGSDYAPHKRDGVAQVTVKNIDSEDSATRYSVAGRAIVSLLTQDASPSRNHDDPTVPVITVVALEPRVNEGSPARFQVESSMSVGFRFMVNLRAYSSTEIIRGSSTISVVIEPDARVASFEMATHNDELAGNDSRLTASIVDGEGYRIGSQGSATVVISDEQDRLADLNSAVLPEIAASIGARTLEATGSRVAQAFSGGVKNGLELAGGSSITDMLETGGLMANSGGFDWRTVLNDSSFTASLDPDGGESGSATVWGLGHVRNLSEEAGGQSQGWEGDVFTGHLGFDAMAGQGLLAGLAASVTQADLEIEEVGGAETLLGIRTTGMHPYLGLESGNGDSRIQLTAGYGVSEMRIDGDRYSTDNLNGNFHMFGVEGNRRLIAREGLTFEGSNSLSVEVESWITGQRFRAVTGINEPLSAVASHMRLALEGKHFRTFMAGHEINPTVSIGLRRDGRNGLTAYSYEICSGVTYEVPVEFTAEASGVAVVSGLDRIDEWEMQGSVNYDAGSDGLGVLASFQPAWAGKGPGEQKYFWSRELLEVSDSASIRSNGTRIDSEIGFGFTLAEGSWTLNPYLGASLSEGRSNEIRIGNRFRTGNGINFEIKGLETVGTHGIVSHDIKLNGGLNW